MSLTRRSATGLIGGLVTLSALLSTAVFAKSRDKAARHTLGVYYPWKPDAKFDYDYYRDKHLKMLAELYGKSVGKMQVRKGLRKGDGSSPAFVTALSVEILSMEAYEAASKAHVSKLIADVANFTNITPVAQIEEIV